jgi:hypothetical protein
MRSFSDEQGVQWEATVGRESWGSFVVLFSASGPEPRKSLLAAETTLQAEQELDAMSDVDLRSRLETSEPWA